MKSIKALFAIVLACALALGLFACAPLDGEETEKVEKTPLLTAQADPLAYFNALVGLIPGAEGFVMETGYGMDDIKAGDDIPKDVANAAKGSIIDYIRSAVTYSKKPAEKEEPIGAAAEKCPALFYALQAGDLLEELKLSDVLELRVAERLATLETDLQEGRNTSMKGKSDAEKRQYVLDQMGESAVLDAGSLYQIEGKLSLGAVEQLYAPADKAAILAQLARAKDYLLAEDYALEPTELTLFATVNKAFIEKDNAAQQVTDPALADDHIKELTFTLKADLTATATGTGAFEALGEFPITLTLTKTVKYKDIIWEAPKDANA